MWGQFEPTWLRCWRLVSRASSQDPYHARADGLRYDLAVMAATRTDLESSLFGDNSFKDKVERFAMDGSIMVAYITKERNLRQYDEEEEVDDVVEEGEL